MVAIIMFVIGLFALPASAVMYWAFAGANRDMVALAMTGSMIGGTLLLAGAFLLAFRDASRGLILGQPARVEVSDRIKVGRHDFATAEVRRVELHHEHIPNHADVWIVAILLSHHVIELRFDDSDEAGSVAAGLTRRLPGAADFTARDRPMFRAYTAVTIVVIVFAVFAICGFGFLPLFLSGPLATWLPGAGVLATAVLTYFAVRWSSRSMALAYVRTEYQLDERR